MEDFNIYDIYYIVELDYRFYEDHPSIRRTSLKGTFCAKLINFSNGKFFFEKEEGGMIIIEYKYITFMAPAKEHCGG